MASDFDHPKSMGMLPLFQCEISTGKIWSYQLLNPDGTKIVPKGSMVKGLFHELQPISDGDLIGLAEGYSTSATCYELTGIPMVCAFFCENLVEVASNLAKKHCKSKIIVFADNDRHLEEQGMLNIGVLSALEAVKQVDLCVWYCQNQRSLIVDLLKRFPIGMILFA